MPERKVEKDPLVIKVWNDDGKRGKLVISQGGVLWMPRHGKRHRAFSWEKLAKLLEG
jgi:hypothetical protein